MKFTNKFLMLATAGTLAITLVATDAMAERDVNKAAESVVVTKTTYSYDSNNDGFIDPSEFNTYITRSVDTDGDGYLESTEYDEGSMTYFYSKTKAPDAPQAEVKSYTYWDKDNDKRLDSGEIETLVANRGIYKAWDTNLDGKIDHNEFSIGTFKSYDDNNDGSISISEWSDVTL